MKEISALQKLLQQSKPQLPKILQQIENLGIKKEAASHTETTAAIQKYFPRTKEQPILHFSASNALQHQPLKIGAVFSGGPASGGHNVIIGIYDALKKLNSKSQLYGFLNGPSGIVDNKHIELTGERIYPYLNQGGFDLIGTGRTKIETPEQFQNAAKAVQELNLDGLVIIGGDDSNTNAALLAEYFLDHHVNTKVIGVPKTIDGDLKNKFIEASFGFDSAAKSYSNAVGSVLRDSLSQKKYYFFIKLMGRSASNIALECALQTQPTLTLIGEEIAAKKQTVQNITNEISDLIISRAQAGKYYGVILIPEGIVEFIPEINVLIKELNKGVEPEQLSDQSKQCYQSLPKEIQHQLLLDRDPHGNVKVSQIEIERLFIESVKTELEKRSPETAKKFAPQPLFFGYEGRSCFPSVFDSTYCYALGHLAALLINAKATGYMACIQNLAQPVEQWTAAGVPLAEMIHLEERHGSQKPVIKKALVDLEGKPFLYFKENRKSWANNDHFRYPGPIQFFGPSELVDCTTLTLQLESGKFCL